MEVLCGKGPKEEEELRSAQGNPKRRRIDKEGVGRRESQESDRKSNGE